MTINIGAIREFCELLKQEVALAYPGLEVYFLLHKKGKLRESIDLAEHEIVSHRAGNAARHILKKHHKGD